MLFVLTHQIWQSQLVFLKLLAIALAMIPLGKATIVSPEDITPLLTLPLTLIPLYLYTHHAPIKNGSDARLSLDPASISTPSIYSAKVGPTYHLNESTDKSLLTTLFPVNPEIGIKSI